jgi:hypothetical protein
VNTLRESLRQSRGIVVSLWWNAALLVGGVAAWPFDSRRILGLNPWVKPMKFEISGMIFLLTVAVMLWAVARDGRWRKSRAVMGWGFGIVMIVEDTIIALQSARGVRSHMNFATHLDALLFAVMGIFITLNTLIGAWLLVLWLRAKTEWPRAVVWGVRLGLLMLLIASVEGVRIVGNGGHTVGAVDGGSGLPFLNWSTAHGDLRVAHFFALHALQLFPLAGLVMVRTRWREGVQVASVFGFAVVYAAGVWWMFAEAMRGMPLVR